MVNAEFRISHSALVPRCFGRSFPGAWPALLISCICFGGFGVSNLRSPQVLERLDVTTSRRFGASLTAGVSTLRVQVVKIDGTQLEGEWLGVASSATDGVRYDDGPGVKLQTETGIQVVSLDDLSGVEFGSVGRAPNRTSRGLQSARGSAQAEAGGSVTFFLADGGRLGGELLRSATDAVVGRTVLSAELTLPFRRLAGIQFTEAEAFVQSRKLFEAALQTRLPGHDVLITRDEETPPGDPRGVKPAASVRGRIVELGAERGRFAFGGNTRSFSIDKIYGVVFAAGARELSAEPVTCWLTDGSTFSGRLRSADRERIKITASFGVEVEVPIARVLRLVFRSSRVVYVSDLSPTRTDTQGRLHRPWPVRRDRSVSGGPLLIDGRSFAKGLGVHSRTELVFELGGVYESFAATVGIDDRARPRGSVVFRVSDLSSPEALYDSGLVTGRDEPRSILIDVSEVQRLALLVDYGDGLDLSDHADWGDARLIRKKTSKRQNVETSKHPNVETSK